MKIKTIQPPARLIAYVLVALSMAACSVEVEPHDGGSTTQEDDEASPAELTGPETEAKEEAKEEAGECQPAADTAGQPMDTCADDCDCQPGLQCQPCVATAEHDCTYWCKPGDPNCSAGVTCPIQPGAICEAVMLCQP